MRVARRGVLEGSWIFLFLAVVSAVFMYLHLFRIPFVPIVRGGDQWIYLEHAARMLHGQVIYRDLFEFNLPGAEYLYLFFFRIFGLRLWVAPVIFLATSVAITLLIYSLARLVLDGAVALLPPLAYLIACQRSAIDGNHHWYSTLLVLLAINIIARTRRLMFIGCAGVLLSLATLLTSTRGVSVAIGLSLFFLWSLRRENGMGEAMAALWIPLGTVTACGLIYLGGIAGFRTLYESIIIFPLRYYPAGYANNPSIYYGVWTDLLPLHLDSFLGISVFLAVSVLAPFVLIAFVYKCLRSRSPEFENTPRHRILVLCAFTGIFALLPVLGAPSAPRINCSAAFAYILGAALLQDFLKRQTLAYLVAGTCAIAGLLMLVALIRPKPVVHGLRGDVAFLDQADADYFNWFLKIANPSDLMFGDTQVNVILGIENPSKLVWVEPDDYTRPEDVRRLVSDLEKTHARFVSWNDDLDVYQGPEDHLQPLRAFLNSHYHELAYGGSKLMVLNSPNTAHSQISDQSTNR